MMSPEDSGKFPTSGAPEAGGFFVVKRPPEDEAETLPDQVSRLQKANTEHEALAKTLKSEHASMAEMRRAALNLAEDAIKAEAALRVSEERFRGLFESIDEGFCIIEVLFGPDGRPADYRFLEANPAFEKHTGLVGAIGRRMREMAPGHEAHWFEIYGRVALTGEPTRFENDAAALGRYFDVYAFRVGSPKDHQVAILFRDISERKRREANTALRDLVSQDLARLTDPAQLIQTAGARVGKYLNLSGCIFVDVDEAGASVSVHYGWLADEIPDLKRTFRLKDYHPTEDFRQACRAGHVFFVNDTVTDRRINSKSFAELKIGSFLTIPYLRDDKWVAYFAAISVEPRDWRKDEIDLMRQISERLFARVERARAEEAIRASEEQWHAIINQTTAGIARSDVTGRLTFVNQKFCEMLGRDASALAGRSMEDFTFHEDLPHDLVLFHRLAETGQPFEIEKRYCRPDGSIIWVHNSVSALRGPSGKITQLLTVSVDITQQQDAKIRLAAAEERLRLIVESALEHAIISLDINRQVISWNPGAEAILGYSPGEIRGKSVDLLFTQEDREHGVPMEEMTIALGKGRAGDNRWMQRKDGSRFWANGAILPMHARHGGEVIGFVKILRDETVNREAHLALEENREKLWEALQENQAARAEVEAASAGKDRFLAVLSHELRTPLTPIFLAMHMLELSPDLSEEVREAIEMIRRNLKIEAQLIDDLLDVTRIANGKFEIIQERLDVHDAVRRAVEVTDGDVREKHLRVTFALDATQHHVCGDFARLQQAFWNLLKNAAKFTPENGEIRIRSRNEDGRILISVTDTGIGIPPEALGKIFDAFIQAGTEITRKFGGLGLGLAIVKAATEAHGGHIHVASGGRDLGATFTIELPVRLAEEAESEVHS